MPDPAREIIKAAKSGDVERVRVLLANDKSLVNARDKDGSTPLHCAVWKGHQQVAVLLIEAGADVNAHNENDHWGHDASACCGSCKSSSDRSTADRSRRRHERERP
jgi:ankyrin repeat protein